MEPVACRSHCMRSKAPTPSSGWWLEEDRLAQRLEPIEKTVLLGGNEGLLDLRDAKQQSTITLRAVHGDDASIAVGGSSAAAGSGAQRRRQGCCLPDRARQAPARSSWDKTGKTVISLKGYGAAGFFGGLGSDGDLIVLPKEATATPARRRWRSGAIAGTSSSDADCAEEFDRGRHRGGRHVLVLNDRVVSRRPPTVRPPRRGRRLRRWAATGDRDRSDPAQLGVGRWRCPGRCSVRSTRPTGRSRSEIS